jgi:hypothetical protein
MTVAGDDWITIELAAQRGHSALLVSSFALFRIAALRDFLRVDARRLGVLRFRALLLRHGYSLSV